MTIAAKLAALQQEAREAANPHVQTIREALEVIDYNRAKLEAQGLSVDITWPYGRGEFAKAANSKIRVSASINVI